MLRSFLFGCTLVLAPLSAAFAQGDSWSSNPAIPPPAPAAAVAPAATPDPAQTAGVVLTADSATTAAAATSTDPNPEVRPAAGSSSMGVSAAPRLNPNSSTSPYNAKAVKESRQLAEKMAEKSKKRTFRNRDVMERKQTKSIKQMRKGRF